MNATEGAWNMQRLIKIHLNGRKDGSPWNNCYGWWHQFVIHTRTYWKQLNSQPLCMQTDEIADLCKTTHESSEMGYFMEFHIRAQIETFCMVFSWGSFFNSHSSFSSNSSSFSVSSLTSHLKVNDLNLSIDLFTRDGQQLFQADASHRAGVMFKDYSLIQPKITTEFLFNSNLLNVNWTIVSGLTMNMCSMKYWEKSHVTPSTFCNLPANNIQNLICTMVITI